MTMVVSEDLEKYWKLLDSRFPQVQDVFEPCMQQAFKVLTNDGLTAYLESASFLGKMGWGVEPILIFLEEWPVVAKTLGEASLSPMMDCIKQMWRSPNSKAIAPFLQALQMCIRDRDETGQAKLFSANITADDHYEMCARADFILEAFGPDADKVAFLVDGYVGGPGMVTTARRQYPNQYLHYHRAGHGAVTSPSAKRGYTAFVLAKMSRLQGASGIHVGTMGYGKMEGEGDDRIIAYMIERDECQGPVYFQKWYGMKPTTPIISGGMNALRLPGFFKNLGHGNVINTSGGGAYGHIDSPAAGGISLRQSYECWKSGADPIEYAKEHKEFARAFESFPGDADKLFPGWREKLGVHR